MPGVEVNSEIGTLKGVILHPPGPEVEHMTPQHAQRALYSDILNLSIARKEYEQLEGVLQKLAPAFRVMDLLREILRSEQVRENLVKRVCYREGEHALIDPLLELDESELARQMIEGVPLDRTTLTDYLSSEYFSLRPLHNFFFTRDSSVVLGNQVLVSRMANPVREREALIIRAIFDYHPRFRVKTIAPDEDSHSTRRLSLEGGDILAASGNITLVGLGKRTSAEGIDFLAKTLSMGKKRHHILVQELPSSPESFIHLDMAFTILDQDRCMVFEPLILRENRYQTLQIDLEDGKVASIRNVENLVVALKDLGMDLKPLLCGGTNEGMIQEREQWHSGANFFSVGPGKLIGYNRNVHTLKDLNQDGFEVIKARDVISGKVELESYSKYVITIDGAELSRGGGGARCMTLPFRRDPV